MAEINVTPLVDVMLVLLIVFVVTAPLLKAAVPIDLPQSRAKALAEQDDEVTLSLSRDGGIHLGNVEVSQNELADRLAALSRSHAGKPPLVTLRADRRLDYGQIMSVMGELNHAGFNAISLVTLGAGDASVRKTKDRVP